MKGNVSKFIEPTGWLRRLRDNESGVASFISLAFIAFIIVLYLYVLAFSVNVNRKIALQMAVDNAAHNAAAAQADILSRIAVVNKAIAHTYVQNNRMHVDYLLHRYAFDILRAFWYDSNEAAELEIKYSPNSCAWHRPGGNIYDSTYKSKRDKPDSITLEDIRKQLPKLFTAADMPGNYLTHPPTLIVAGEVDTLGIHLNDRQYGVSSNGFWNQEFDEENVPSTIFHGNIATPDSLKSQTIPLINVNDLYNFVKTQQDGGKGYKNLMQAIIKGSDNLVMLNKELPRLVLMLDKYVYDTIRSSLDDINMAGTSFFIQIGNKVYPYTRNTPLAQGYFGQYNDSAYFQVPDEETFLARRGDYASDYKTGQWGCASFWKQNSETAFFNRYFDDDSLPHIAFWHSWFFQWVCNIAGHFQYGNGLQSGVPFIGALRQADSLRMGYYPNLSTGNDTGARPLINDYTQWSYSLTNNGLNFIDIMLATSPQDDVGKRTFMAANNHNTYMALASSPRIVHGRSDNRWESWETEEGRELSCDYDCSAPAKPILMREAMFGKGGSIIIGACQPSVALVNFGGKDISAPENLYAIAASRAGVRIPGDDAGRYTTSWTREKEWNLFVDDWDAVMIPVAKAWHHSRDLVWEESGNTAAGILSAMKDALGHPEDADFEGNANDIIH